MKWFTAGKPDVFIPSESISKSHRLSSIFKENLSTNSVTLTFLQHSEWTGCTHTQMGMMDTILSLDQLVDESDPDVDFPNSFHAFQTAEGIRQAHPDKGTINRESDRNTRREHVKQIQRPGNCLYLLRLHRLVPVGGSDSWCWEDNGSLGWTSGKRKVQHRRNWHHQGGFIQRHTFVFSILSMIIFIVTTTNPDIIHIQGETF